MHHGARFPHGIPSPPTSPPPCEPWPRYHAPAERLGRLLAGRLRLTAILGHGAYGVVYEARDIYSNELFAVKTLSKFNPDGTPLERRQIEFQTREIYLHHAASGHKNVVSMFRIIEEPDCVLVVLEYCPEGDLFYNITERQRYLGKDELVRRVFLQIIEAVQHCHSRGIFHRDLKPENILVTDNGETVKLADFGLATHHAMSEDYGCGSTFYMSPECLDAAPKKPFYYCAPNDVWSLGVVLVNLTCGRNPWKQASQEDPTYRAFIRSPGFLKTILPLSDELNNILARIFNANPEQRITLADLHRSIQQCREFTTSSPTAPDSPPPSPRLSPEPVYNEPEAIEYVSSPQEPVTYVSPAVVNDDCEPEPLDDGFSDGGSSTGSDCSCPSTPPPFADPYSEIQRPMVPGTPPPMEDVNCTILDAEQARMFSPMDYQQMPCLPIQQPMPCAPVAQVNPFHPVAAVPACAPDSWTWRWLAAQVPQMPHFQPQAYMPPLVMASS